MPRNNTTLYGTIMSNEQQTWKSSSGFIWSLIGSAVGFANILSFSAKVYKNGGGAFLIPYFLALFLLGIPMLILEGLIGKKFKSPLIQAYGSILGSTGRTFGWISILACLTIGAFYVVLTGYSVAYAYFSAAGSIPEDTKSFFLNDFLKLTPNIGDFGSISWPILFCTLGVLTATWVILVKNIRDGIEKICSVFMPALGVLILLFAVTVSFLPGGMDAWGYYLRPDFSKLLDARLWQDIFGQLFFSLSIGLGIIVGYSRYTPEKTDIRKAMVYVALGDFAISFIAGFAIFGCLAHISHVQGIPFESIANSDSTFEIGFILFPKILKFFGPVSSVLGTLFFFCVFIAGITGIFSIVESIAGNVETSFKQERKRAVTLTIAALTLLSIFFCMGNSSHLIDTLAPMLLGTNMLISGLALIFSFYYQSKIIEHDPVWKFGPKWNFFGVSIRFVSPFLLAIILSCNVWVETHNFDSGAMFRWSYLAVVLLASVFISQKVGIKDKVPVLSE